MGGSPVNDADMIASCSSRMMASWRATSSRRAWVNTSARARPRPFARYIAASASRRSDSAVARVPGSAKATPMLTPTVTAAPSSITRCSMASLIRLMTTSRSA